MAPFFVFESFIDYLRIERRYSEHTLIAYTTDLNQFAENLGIQNLEELKEVNHRSVRSWIQELNEKGCVNKTINRKLCTLRSFFKWARKNKIIDQSPLSKIKGPKIEKKLPSFIKASDLQKAEQPKLLDGFDDLRDHLMFELFYQTGIRLSELINLLEKDVQTTQIKVIGKRNKERIIPISSSLNHLINEYLREKKKLVQGTQCLLMLNNGQKLYPKFVYRKINTYIGEVAIMEKRSPHVLRHTFATHMLNNGAGLETLKELLGHANLSATQVYTHNSFTQISNIYSQAHPRGHKTS
jgi:integrase/recombinase XerC